MLSCAPPPPPARSLRQIGYPFCVFLFFIICHHLPAKVKGESSASTLFLLAVLAVIVPALLFVTRVFRPILSLLHAVLHLVHQQLQELGKERNLRPLFNFL